MEFQMPRPTPEHEALQQLSGSWRGVETMMPSAWSPERQERHGRIDARVLEGFFVVSEYEQRTGDQVTFRGHGVYSFDAAAREYVMYWFDSMGGAGGVARGKLVADQLTFENTSPMGRHRYRYTFGPGQLVFEMSMSPDGEQWQLLMRGEYRPG